MLQIVPETPALHADPIEALYDRTFGPGHFAKTAERLREGNSSLAEISRVGLDAGGALIGVCRVWPITVETGGPALFVGPVAVDPAAQGDRVGMKLTRAALEAGKAAGWPFALLIGAPSYFGEVGFQSAETGRFLFPSPQDQARVMFMTLHGAADAYAGEVRAWRTPRLPAFTVPCEQEQAEA